MVSAKRLPGPEGLVLDLDHRTAAVNNQPVNLSRREFDLLNLLLEERGRVVPFEEIGRRAWGYESATRDQRFIYTAAWRVRRALEAVGAPHVIEGVRGIGYIVLEDAATAADSGLDMFHADDKDPLHLHAVVVFDPTDPNLRFSMVNDGATVMTGYSAAALTHLPELARRLWSPEERERINEAVAEALAVGRSRSEGRELTRIDGTTIRVDISFCRLEVPGHSPLAIAEATLVED